MRDAISVIGDALLDIRVAPSEPIRVGADVPADIELGPGGQGANLAVRLARRGRRARLVCALADDAAGDQVRRALEADGVDLVPLAAAATGSVVVLVDRAGERTMLSHRVPFASILAADPSPLPEAAWTVVSGYLLLEPAAMRIARAIAVRPGHRMLVGCAVPDAALGSWLAAATALSPDIRVLNDDEVTRLGRGRDEEGVVVTSATGAVARFGGRDVEVRSSAGPPAVDTTGAGDAFAAALLASLDEVGGWPPGPGAVEGALANAVEAAAGVTRVLGAQARVPGERGGTLQP
jgi:sugar/nucleoside kinase (ribokinase family)